MASPRLALRYRDAKRDINTIAEHRKVIKEQGHVFWGWWKKMHEEQHLSLIERLCGTENFLIIINTSTKECFKAIFSKVYPKNSNQIDQEYIPDYYRDEFKSVEAWFLMTSIVDYDYDLNLEKRIGENTIYVYDGLHSVKDENIQTKNRISTKNSILQLSDLHFGKDHSFRDPSQNKMSDLSRETLSNCLITDLKYINLQNDIEAIVITGDITTQGDWSDETMESIECELLAICKALNISILDVYFVPGNHDVVRYDEGQTPDVLNVNKQINIKHEQKFRFFLATIQDKVPSSPLNYVTSISLKNCDVQLCLLNSCSIAPVAKWTEYGYVGEDGIVTLKKLGKLKIDRPTYRVMALHHHLLPVAQIDNLNEKGVSLTLDAVKLLEIASSVKVCMAFHGHQHIARVANYQKVPEVNDEYDFNPITIISGGSSGVKSDRRLSSMANSYSIITFEQEKPQLQIREIHSDGKRGNTIYDCKLNVEPIPSNP
ncbi:MAG: 3',5'-cyclic AMP phosphodiesterase CpdA [Flavobacteriales bacterium]|jgi:3',5'-cyclic AMP phosphodiesterase CpdA